MRFIIPYEPVPKKRPRFSKGRIYDVQESEKMTARASLIFQLTQHRDSKDQSILGQLNALCEATHFRVSLEFHCTSTKIDLWGLHPSNSKTDVDNYIKFYLDAANTILYSDDHKIVALKAIKCYSPFKPKTIIDIEPMNVTPQISDSEIKVLKVFTPDMMKDFLYDVGVLAQYSPADWDIMTKEESMDWTSDVAKLQYSFAQKWSDKLKKVAK